MQCAAVNIHLQIQLIRFMRKNIDSKRIPIVNICSSTVYIELSIRCLFTLINFILVIFKSPTVKIVLCVISVRLSIYNLFILLNNHHVSVLTLLYTEGGKHNDECEISSCASGIAF